MVYDQKLGTIKMSKPAGKLNTFFHIQFAKFLRLLV